MLLQLIVWSWSWGALVLRKARKTILIMSMRSFGQSNEGCGIILQMSLSGGFCKLQGKYKYSPSNSVNCCVIEANIDPQHAFSFVDCWTCWGTAIIHGFGMSGIVGSFWIHGGSSASSIVSLIVMIGGNVDSDSKRFHLTVSFLLFIWLISKRKGWSDAARLCPEESIQLLDFLFSALC